MKEINIEIHNKIYEVKVAETDEERMIGLSLKDDLDQDEGMLFVFSEPLQDLWFTMEDTALDLDIIFLDADKRVTSVNPVEAYTEEPIPDKQGNAQFVLEVPINSGIEIGDVLTEASEDIDFDDEEKEIINHSRMLILDENGDVQYKLQGGERIVSRIKTRELIKQAIKAFKKDEDDEYIKLGKMVFKELDAQDTRPSLYVESPKSENNNE